MLWAITDNGRSLPSPGAKGNCPGCGGEVLAKCGEHVAWHWAHIAKDCDPWSEPESEWHRQWKDRFPVEWQEKTIGPHRADVLTPKGVIEFQRSSISSEDIREREQFYGKMVWLLDASQFHLELKLPFVLNAPTFRQWIAKNHPDHNKAVDPVPLFCQTKTPYYWGRQATMPPRFDRTEFDSIRIADCTSFDQKLAAMEKAKMIHAKAWSVCSDLELSYQEAVKKKEELEIELKQHYEREMQELPMAQIISTKRAYFRWKWTHPSWKAAVKSLFFDLSQYLPDSVSIGLAREVDFQNGIVVFDLLSVADFVTKCS